MRADRTTTAPASALAALAPIPGPASAHKPAPSPKLAPTSMPAPASIPAIALRPAPTLDPAPRPAPASRPGYPSDAPLVLQVIPALKPATAIRPAPSPDPAADPRRGPGPQTAFNAQPGASVGAVLSHKTGACPLRGAGLQTGPLTRPRTSHTAHELTPSGPGISCRSPKLTLWSGLHTLDYAALDVSVPQHLAKPRDVVGLAHAETPARACVQPCNCAPRGSEAICQREVVGIRREGRPGPAADPRCEAGT
jgi:hypothetical protein